jgi:hypothetical protein
MEAKIYPLDYDTLNKGDLITREQVEDITGARFGTPAYEFKRMGLKADIERALWRRGKVWTVTAEGCNGGLTILADADAVEYNMRDFERARSRQVVAHYRAMGVDVTQLTDEQRARHERNITLQASEIQAAKTARRIALKAKTRDVPQIGVARQG